MQQQAAVRRTDRQWAKETLRTICETMRPAQIMVLMHAVSS